MTSTSVSAHSEPLVNYRLIQAHLMAAAFFLLVSMLRARTHRDAIIALEPAD